MQKKAVFGFLAIVTLQACVSSKDYSVPISYSYKDLPDKRRIELTYVNKENFMVCVPKGAFALESGGTDAEDNMELIVNDEVFTPRPIPFDEYCVGGCDRRVEAQETLVGYVPYSWFNLPRELRYAPKELRFNSYGYRCGN